MKLKKRLTDIQCRTLTAIGDKLKSLKQPELNEIAQQIYDYAAFHGEEYEIVDTGKVDDYELVRVKRGSKNLIYLRRKTAPKATK